jgi:hypothetical protein
MPYPSRRAHRHYRPRDNTPRSICSSRRRPMISAAIIERISQGSKTLLLPSACGLDWPARRFGSLVVSHTPMKRRSPDQLANNRRSWRITCDLPTGSRPSLSSVIASRSTGRAWRTAVMLLYSRGFLARIYRREQEILTSGLRRESDILDAVTCSRWKKVLAR